MGSTNARTAAIAALTSFKAVAPRVNFQKTPLKDVFASKGITTMDALADLATDALTEMTGMDAERATRLIMKAREPWFKEQPQQA